MRPGQEHERHGQRKDDEREKGGQRQNER
jgi:hypothetical protein